MVERGVAGPRATDRTMELGHDQPIGPLELADVLGLDVQFAVLERFHEELGEGFYRWESREIVGVSDESR